MSDPIDSYLPENLQVYKAHLKLHSDSIDGPRQRIYLPILATYALHSVVVSISGKAEEEDREFVVELPFVNWNEEAAGYRIENTDVVSLEANYHYKSSYNDPACSALGKAVITAARDETKSQQDSDLEEKRAEIFIKHYIDAQFSLDNGLFKEAALNFGTALEAILNRSLAKGPDLKTLIETEAALKSIHSECDLIRQVRNKVHPNNIAASSDVCRREAQQCRTVFERVLRIYTQGTT